MPAWIILQPADVNDYLVAALGSAASGKALGSGQTPTTARVIADITSRVRTEVASFDLNRLSLTANSIPPALKTDALALVAEALVNRIALALDEATLRQINRAGDNARATMRRVATGQLRVELPDDPIPASTATVPQSGGIEVVAAPPRRASQGGLSRL